MKNLVFALVVLLLLLHHDFWFWDNDTLLMGFMPIGMGYHMLISLAAAVIWYLATVYAWPDELAEEPSKG